MFTFGHSTGETIVSWNVVKVMNNTERIDQMSTNVYVDIEHIFEKTQNNSKMLVVCKIMNRPRR